LKVNENTSPIHEYSTIYKDSFSVFILVYGRLDGPPSEGYPSKFRYEGSQEDERERKIEKSFSGAEPDMGNIFPSITKPCEDMLEEKFVYGVEPYIDINSSSIEKTNACLIEKEEEEETNKKEETFMTLTACITEKESLKRNYNTLNSSFQLYNAHSSSQKSQKTLCDVVA